MENMELNSEFWQDRRVLITGHTGFKGAWLSMWLHQRGAHVIGFSIDPPSEPNLFTQANIESCVDHHFGDIRNSAQFNEIVSRSKPELIIHMAAQAIVREGYKHPLETFETNIMGTANVLEVAGQSDCIKAALVITSDKCYQNNEEKKSFVESDPMGGNEPYSASKGAAELVAHSFRNVHPHLNIATARAGNVIGGGDWATDRLIPDLIRSFSKNKPAFLRNPMSIRPWQHVLDPLHGYLLLAEALLREDSTVSCGWNFGPCSADARSVQWVADEAVQRWGANATWCQDPDTHPHESEVLLLDSSKAEHELDWSQNLTPEESIAWTVDWYHQVFKGENPANLCLEQLEKFESTLQIGTQ